MCGFYSREASHTLLPEESTEWSHEDLFCSVSHPHEVMTQTYHHHQGFVFICTGMESFHTLTDAADSTYCNPPYVCVYADDA